MKLRSLLPGLAALCLGLPSAHALSFSFDSQEELSQVSQKPAKLSLCAENKAAGAASCLIQCDLDVNGVKIDLPQAGSQGVVTFWMYDPLFETRERMDRGFDVQCATVENGKPKSATFWLHSGAGKENWYYRDSEGVRDHDFYVPRHRGWTRFDIVNPAGDGPQPFLIYIDGRLAGKTPTAFTAMKAVIPKSFWGNGSILIDEFSFDADPASLKPNVLQAVHAREDESGTVALGPEEKLAFEFALAPGGARAKNGKLAIALLDGAENEVARQSVELDWEKQKESLAVEFPRPPHSGRYWIKADYTEEGTEIPQQLISRFDLQYHARDFDTRGRSVTLAAAWDWLPVGDKAPYRVNIATPAAVPAAPPRDWSAARPVKGVWNRDFNLTYQAGWYHRKIAIPREWQGAPVSIGIDEPQTIAAVYLDNVNAGEIEWPGGTLDITKYARPGATHDLAIFVRAEAIAGYNRVLREILGDSYKPTECVYMRGLRGRVELRSEPRGASIERTALVPRVSRGELEVTVYLKNLRPGAQYSLRSAVTAAGKTALAIPEQSFTAATPTVKASFKAPWKDAVLWDIGKPFLYDFHAALCEKDRPVDIRPPERFGFREVKFDGRLVKLNGRVINLFGPITEQFNAFGASAGLKEMHSSFDFGVGFRHAVALGAGDSALQDYADFCANAGIGGNVRLGWFYTKMLLAQGKENDPRYWAFFDKMVRYETARYGNNPGIFFWADLGSLLDMGSLYNPLLQDGLWIRDFSATPQLEKLAKVQKRAVGMIRAADPSRHVIGQNTGNFLDACQITHYAGFAPIQELVEMNDLWVEHGVKPLFYTEQAAPFINNWTNQPRDKGHSTSKLIPYEAEWCAITKGDRAFERTPLDEKVLAEYEKLSKGRFDAIRKIADEAQRRKALENYSNNAATGFPTHLYEFDETNLRNEVARDRILEQILNWRADGIGLLITSYFHDLGHRMPEVLDTALAPVTAFISGPADNRHDRTHIYAPGETLRRGIVLLNNSARARKVRCEWKVELSGTVAGSRNEEAELAAGGTLRLPVECPLAAKGDAGGTLSMSLRDAESGQKLREEKAPFTVLAPRAFAPAKKIALIDPEGDSAAALKRAGVPFRLVPFTADLAPFDIVAFGRRAFDYELKASERGIDLGRLAQAGKRVVILEQSEAALRGRFRFRTEYISPRNVYPREAALGLFDGLPEGCLQFWRGDSTLTDGYAIARENLKPRQNEGNGGRWFYAWNDGKEHTRPVKWGNHHNVATVVVEKPDTGAFRALADCEFGLNYAAAWQLQHGGGYVLFSQLDVSGRSEAAPEAARYLQNLFRYTEALPVPAPKAALYLGGEKGSRLLTQLGVPFTTDPAQANPARHLIVLGDVPPGQLAAWKPALEAFAKAGGTVFSLPKTPEQLASGWTPVPVTAALKPANHTVIGTSRDTLLAGLGNSDFYWKGNIEIPALQAIEGADLQTESGILARVPQGKGCWIFCQFEPSMLAADPDYFWLKDSQRAAERALRTLLSNAQAAMAAPALLKAPGGGPAPFLSQDLAGEWQCGFGRGDSPQASPISQVSRWKKVILPGSYREKGWDAPSGSLWYARRFDVPELPKEPFTARFNLGAAEGVDHVLINGRPIGTTSRITNPDDLSTALRSYAVPAGLLKPGANEIAIFVQFDTAAPLSPGNGNLATPLSLEFFGREAPQNAGEGGAVVGGPYLHELDKTDDPYAFCGW